MYLRYSTLLLLFCLCFITTRTFAFENLVYTWRGFPSNIMGGTIAIDDLKLHASQIDILSSQAYHIDEKGLLYGSQNPQILQIAKSAHAKIMPLIGNGNFDRDKTHMFLSDLAAQNRAIQSVLQLCKQNKFYGVQIDFEGMSYLDRDAFTQFFQKITNALHQQGFQVSIAIVPMVTEDVPANNYLRGRYKGWAGVYDYQALGKIADFVTLMAYDQHGSNTPPGPMAGLTWDEAIIQYALKFIPAEKLSLGIPWHSGYWYIGKNSDHSNILNPIAITLNYADMMRILKDNHAVLHWDNENKINYAIYTHHFLYEYIYAEDVDSFRAKLDLVKKYKLRGISNWCLGEEDPKVWASLPKKMSGVENKI